MVRIYRETAQALLTCLAYVRQSGNADYRNMSARVFDYGRPSDMQANTWNQINSYARNDNKSGGSLDEIEQALTQQLEKGADVEGDKHLINIIVSILQLPRARQMISTKMMEQLRRAILLPSELAGLTHKLEAKECYCPHCGKQIESGEMTTLHQEGDHAWGLYCASCVLPSKIKLAKSGKVTELPTVVLKRITGVINKLPLPEDVAPAESPNDDLSTQINQARQAAQPATPGRQTVTFGELSNVASTLGIAAQDIVNDPLSVVNHTRQTITFTRRR